MLDLLNNKEELTKFFKTIDLEDFKNHIELLNVVFEEKKERQEKIQAIKEMLLEDGIDFDEICEELQSDKQSSNKAKKQRKEIPTYSFNLNGEVVKRKLAGRLNAETKAFLDDNKLELWQCIVEEDRNRFIADRAATAEPEAQIEIYKEYFNK